MFSSKDSNKISLTIKGALTGVVTLMIAVNLPTESLPEVIGAFTGLVEQTIIWLAALATFVGAVRKVIRTYSGNNSVLNNSTLN